MKSINTNKTTMAIAVGFCLKPQNNLINYFSMLSWVFELELISCSEKGLNCLYILSSTRPCNCSTDYNLFSKL